MTKMTSHLRPVTSLFLCLAPSSKAKENNVHLFKNSKMKMYRRASEQRLGVRYIEKKETDSGIHVFLSCLMFVAIQVTRLRRIMHFFQKPESEAENMFA